MATINLYAQAAPDSVPKDDWDFFVELDSLLKGIGLSLHDLPGVKSIDIQGRDPLVDSARIRYGAVAALPAVAIAMVAVQIHYLRANREIRQSISCDLRQAYQNHDIMNEHFYPTLNGHMHNHVHLRNNPFLHDAYATKDGKLGIPVAVYPEHKLKWYRLLNIPPLDSESVRTAFKQYSADELKSKAEEEKLPFSIVQTSDEFLNSTQGKIMIEDHPCAITKILESPIKPVRSSGAQPLSGVKVLMCTHAIAGPSAGRVLAEYGADVLQIFRPGVGFEHEIIYNEANTGCRSTQLDLSDPDNLLHFFDLISEADVFIESFAPGAMEGLGINRKSLLERNPNLIICSTKLFGLRGPWKGLKGHDQNASASVGTLHTLGQHATWQETGQFPLSGERAAHETKIAWPEPGLVNDFTTGLFGALGIMVCLLRRMKQGGAWQVGPSLAATCTWYLYKLQPVPADVFELARGLDIASDDAAIYSPRPPQVVEGQTPKGYYRRAGHIVQLDKTPLRWPTPLISVQGADVPIFKTKQISRKSNI